ncbi:MAG TPA: hypothetical protein VGS59_08785 [Candidatus Acidoferrales bacterium]|nr:hypothetical protein [Candidatus Acidoferrales bacterium]
MKHKDQYSPKGFGIVELLIVAAIAITILAIATPTILQAYRSYKVSSAAAQVDMMVKYTRLEAIRLNTSPAAPINLDCQQLGNGKYQIWTDSNKTGILQNTEKRTFFNSGADLMALAAVPATAQITAALGGTPLVGIAPGNGPMLGFDGRGAVANPAGVYAIAVGDTVAPKAGYRIIVVLPSGSTQIWSGDAYGNWHQTN